MLVELPEVLLRGEGLVGMGHCPAEGWAFGGATPARFGHRRSGTLKPGCAHCSRAGDREHPVRTQVSIAVRLKGGTPASPGVLGERGGNWGASWAAGQALEDVRTGQVPAPGSSHHLDLLPARRVRPAALMEVQTFGGGRRCRDWAGVSWVDLQLT